MNRRKDTFLMITALIVVVAAAAALVWWGTRQRSSSLTSTATSEAVVASQLESIAIEPSRLDAGWMMYSKGAVIAVTGKGLREVVVRYFPTGSGIGEITPAGEELGKATKESTTGETERWVLPLPEGLLTTNLWAVGTGVDGQVHTSQDLGNVGYEN